MSDHDRRVLLGALSQLSTRWGRTLWQRVQLVAAQLFAAAPGLAADELQVLVFEDGRSQALDLDAVRRSGLLAVCEGQLRGSTSVLRLAVSNETVRHMQNAGLSLELRYPQSQRFVLGALGDRVVPASRVFVPLSGELAGDVSTWFLGDPAYRSGPLRNKAGTAELARHVQALRAQR